MQAQLYVDGSPESQKAEELLKKNDITYDRWEAGVNFPVSENDTLPALYSAEGSFKGLRRIRGYLVVVKGVKSYNLEREKKRKRLAFNFIWYDIWIGIYINRKKRTVYIAPFPMLIISVRY